MADHVRPDAFCIDKQIGVLIVSGATAGVPLQVIEVILSDTECAVAKAEKLVHHEGGMMCEEES